MTEIAHNIRPSAEYVEQHGGVWIEPTTATPGVGIEHRIEVVGHRVCEWESATWPDERDRRMLEHLGECPQNRHLRNVPTQPRAWDRLGELVLHARQLYNDPRVGRDRISLEDVAQAAGVSIGTIYRYWIDRVQMLDYIAPRRDMKPIL